jgi:uncharacterized protein
MLTRRTFLRALRSSAVLAAGAGLYTWRFEPHWLEVVRRPLPIAELPDSLAGRTLVQLSDIHVGLRVDDDYVLETFDRVTALRPDIVVLSGDSMSYHPEILDQMEPVYRRFPHGSLATLATLGNHDYGPDWAHPEIAQGVAALLERAGLRVLRNETVDVAGLRVAGLDDLWAKQFRPEAPLRAIAAGGPAIVVSHNPDTVDLPVWGGYDGWILSGHTHGGQCKPPFLPPPLLPVRNRRYTAGEFALSGGRKLYVSRGVGHLLRVRFNVRPEVTEFVLQRA